MIKNQFYSTLRRQLRKINRILQSNNFKILIGGEIKEVSQDELYKYIKDEKVSYDDIKGIYIEAIDNTDASHVLILKTECIGEVQNEKESEAKNNMMNRRSYRLSKKQPEEGEREYDLSKVAFLVLFKLLRRFREENKDNLDNIYSQNSSDSPKSCNRIIGGCTSKNKRKRKAILKKEENEETLKIQNKLKEKYSNPQDKGLIPGKYKDLFSNLKLSEGEDSDQLGGNKNRHPSDKFQNKFIQQDIETTPKIRMEDDYFDD